MSSTSFSAESSDSLAFYEEGRLLSKGKTKHYTEMLESDPDNLEIRLRLIGFWERQQGRRGVDLIPLGDHLGWLIRNYPEDSVHQWISLVPYRDEHYRSLRREWLRQVRRQPSNTSVLDNAAHFFQWLDRKDAERFWLMAQELEQLNDDYPRQLSALYERWCLDTGSKRYAQKSVDCIIAALDLHNVRPRQSYLNYYVEMITCQLGEALLMLKIADLAIKLGNRMLEAEWWPTEIECRGDIVCVVLTNT